jgi:hypothetical protein
LILTADKQRFTGIREATWVSTNNYSA